MISFLGIFSLLPSNSFAEAIRVGDGITAQQDPLILYATTPSVTFTFFSKNLFFTGQDYTFFSRTQPSGQENAIATYRIIRTDNPSVLRITLNLDNISKTNTPGTWIYKLAPGGKNEAFNESGVIASDQYYIYKCANIDDKGCPSLGLRQNTFSAYDKETTAYIVNPQPDHKYVVWFQGEDQTTYRVRQNDITTTFPAKDNKIFPAAQIKINTGPPSSAKTLCLTENIATVFGIQTPLARRCDFWIPNIIISALPVSAPSVSPTPIQSNNPGIPTPGDILQGEAKIPPPLPPCAQWANLSGTPIPIQNVGDRKDIKCVAIETAIGSISTEPQKFVKSIFSIVLGLAGGIALILIIISGYQIMASQGNPEALAAGRGRLIGAIVGLLFIIFSFVILQVIGVDILKIPGFNP